MSEHSTLPAAMPPQDRPPHGIGLVTWAGLSVVLIAAAVLSFAALRDLAIAVRIPDPLAPLLPIAIDAGGAVSCATWLSRRADRETSRFACAMTWALLVLTVVGNAAQLGMHASGIAPPWWVAVAVGAVPPAVVGGTVHLAVLASRGTTPFPERRRAAPVHPDLRERARLLVASGAGRPRLASELGLTDHHARQLINQIRNEITAASNGSTTT